MFRRIPTILNAIKKTFIFLDDLLEAVLVRIWRSRKATRTLVWGGVIALGLFVGLLEYLDRYTSFPVVEVPHLECDDPEAWPKRAAGEYADGYMVWYGRELPSNQLRDGDSTGTDRRASHFLESLGIRGFRRDLLREFEDRQDILPVSSDDEGPPPLSTEWATFLDQNWVAIESVGREVDAAFDRITAGPVFGSTFGPPRDRHSVLDLTRVFVAMGMRASEAQDRDGALFWMNRCFELARLLESGGTRAATPVEIWSSTLPRFRAYRGFSSPALFRGATETSLHRTLEILERSAPRAAAVKAALELDADASAESFGRWMSRRRGKALWSLGNIPVIWIPDGPFERGALVELARDAMQTCESALMQVWTDGTSAREIGVDLDQVRAELFKTYDDVPGLTDILASCVSRRVEARRYAMSMLGTSLGILYMYVNTRGIHGLLSSIVALELESRVSGPTLATAEDLMNRYPQLKDLQYARDTWSLVVESDGWTLDRSAMNDPAR